MAIADEIQAAGDDISLQFASYATGAQTFRAANRPVHDLQLPETNGYLPTLLKAHELIERLRPSVVAAHEEFAALVAAYQLGVPSIFLSAWLPGSGGINSESLAYASSIIVLENPGIFALPSGITAKPIHVGPIVRKMRYSLDDRASLRAAMKIPRDSCVIAVVPGGAATEESSPIADTVLSAFLQLPQPTKNLFWISNNDFEQMTLRFRNIAGVQAVRFVDPIEQLLVAADVIITKGTRGITLDASALGVPSISLSHGFNPIDDLLVPRIRSNIALNARAVDGDVLLNYLQMVMSRRPNHLSGGKPPAPDGARFAAEVFRTEVGCLVAGNS
jgi:hypothetical protein